MYRRRFAHVNVSWDTLTRKRTIQGWGFPPPPPPPPPPPQPQPAAQCGTLLPNTAVANEPDHTAPASSVAACCALCTADKACGRWTWHGGLQESRSRRAQGCRKAALSLFMYIAAVPWFECLPQTKWCAMLAQKGCACDGGDGGGGDGGGAVERPQRGMGPVRRQGQVHPDQAQVVRAGLRARVPEDR